MTEKENALAFLRHESYEWEMDEDVAQRYIRIPICERPLWGSGYDCFSVHWTDQATVGGGSHYTPGQPPIITDITRWAEQVRIPNAARADWSAFERQADAVDRSQHLVAVTVMMGLLERTTTLYAYEDSLADYLLEPQAVLELCCAVADYKIALIDHIWRYGHPDVIYLHDDWGTARGQLLSPETWRAVIKPHTQRMFDAVKERGMFLGLHSCGRVDAMMDEVAAMGVDVWEAQAGCNDIAGVRERLRGKLSVLTPDYDSMMQTDPNAPPPTPIPGVPPFYPEPPLFLYEA